MGGIISSIKGNIAVDAIKEPEAPQYIIDISSSNITVMPTIPLSTVALLLANNKMQVITSFSDNLRTLDISNNPIIAIPMLPPFLKHLYANNTLLTFIFNLPSDLETLEAHDNPKLDFKEELPSKIKSVNLSRTARVVFRNLPEGLHTINIESINNIQDVTCMFLPGVKFPSTLQYLNMSKNPCGNDIPKLPTGLIELDISDTAISTINLPANLRVIRCNKPVIMSR